MKPIIIYDNNNFNTLSFERKYKSLVEDKINERNKKWSDIKKIIKVERRYERI
jgi:RNase P/RNase MRP subunit p30